MIVLTNEQAFLISTQLLEFKKSRAKGAEQALKDCEDFYKRVQLFRDEEDLKAIESNFVKTVNDIKKMKVESEVLIDKCLDLLKEIDEEKKNG
jgi:hypothetical protein